MKDYTTICSTVISELLAIVALRNKKEIIDSNLTIINQNVKYLEGFCEKYKDYFHYSGINPTIRPPYISLLTHINNYLI